MTRQIKARPMRIRSHTIGMHEIALAGIGAASLARKLALKTLDQLVAFAADFPDQAESLRERMGDASQSLLDHAIVAADDLRIQTLHWATQASQEIQARTKPVLADLGFVRTTQRRSASRKSARTSKRKSVRSKSTATAAASRHA